MRLTNSKENILIVSDNESHLLFIEKTMKNLKKIKVKNVLTLVKLYAPI